MRVKKIEHVNRFNFFGPVLLGTAAAELLNRTEKMLLLLVYDTVVGEGDGYVASRSLVGQHQERFCSCVVVSEVSFNNSLSLTNERLSLSICEPVCWATEWFW